MNGSTRPGFGLVLALAAAALVGAAICRWSRPVRRGEAPTPRLQASLPRIHIDLNEASAAELMLLPGIGAGLAERIVADRDERGRFARVEDLQRVRGIGPATMRRLAPFVAREAHAPAALDR